MDRAPLNSWLDLRDREGVGGSGSDERSAKRGAIPPAVLTEQAITAEVGSLFPFNGPHLKGQ